MKPSGYLLEKGLANAEVFSGRMFAAATGALALSITFKSTITAAAPKFEFILSAAWILLTISILAQLWERLNQAVYFLSAGSGEEKESKKTLRIWCWAMLIAFLSFFFGIIALCVFAVLNNLPVAAVPGAVR